MLTGTRDKGERKMSENQRNDGAYNLRLSLYKKLVELHDNKDFLIGIMSLISHPDDIEAMIDFIENQPDEATPSNITKFAVVMCNDRDGGENEDVEE